MALVVKDRVQETTTTSGTGTVTLAGAVTGFQSFSVIGDGNTTFYTITSGSDWEVGIGTYTSSGTTLSRDTILESSNSGSAITLSGTSNVFCTYPAERSVTSEKVLNWQAVKTADFNAVSGEAYPVNTTSGIVIATLPSSPAVGDLVGFVDYAGTFDTNNFIINPNSNNLNSYPINAVNSQEREGILLVYVDATQGWIPFAGFNTATPTQATTYSANYLIVAGGGGGAGGVGQGNSGGGAGGMLTGSTTLNYNTTYNFVVGAGGAGGITTSAGSQGNNSTGFGLTAIGGGYGGYASQGGSGGSGGGSAGNGATSFSGGAGTSGQGNAGGASQTGDRACGGGGGKGAAGGAGVLNTRGGNGGNGTASSITGSSVTYAGGGAGGGQRLATGLGTAGTGGGGIAGTLGGGDGGNGGTNLGGGGGGGTYNASVYYDGGNGGSGVVIVSVPTVNYTGTTTGSPTVTTSGSNTIMKFTASGSYTA